MPWNCSLNLLLHFRRLLYSTALSTTTSLIQRTALQSKVALSLIYYSSSRQSFPTILSTPDFTRIKLLYTIGRTFTHGYVSCYIQSSRFCLVFWYLKNKGIHCFKLSCWCQSGPTFRWKLKLRLRLKGQQTMNVLNIAKLNRSKFRKLRTLIVQKGAKIKLLKSTKENSMSLFSVASCLIE